MGVTASPARAQAIADRALAKSLAEVEANNLPRLIRDDATGQAWSVHSRTNKPCRHCGAIDDGAAEVHVITFAPEGGVECTCPAGVNCWHRVHAARARAGEIGHFGLLKQKG